MTPAARISVAVQWVREHGGRPTVVFLTPKERGLLEASIGVNPGTCAEIFGLPIQDLEDGGRSEVVGHDVFGAKYVMMVPPP